MSDQDNQSDDDNYAHIGDAYGYILPKGKSVTSIGDFFGLDPNQYDDWKKYIADEAGIESYTKMYKCNTTSPIGTVIQECDHIPINVGFSVPKMVCKKCDKDL